MKQTRHGNGQFPDKGRYKAGILHSEAGQAVPGLWLGQRHLGAEDRRGHRAGPAAPENRPRCQAALAEMSEAGQRHSMFHNSPGPLSGKEKNGSVSVSPRSAQTKPKTPGAPWRDPKAARKGHTGAAPCPQRPLGGRRCHRTHGCGPRPGSFCHWIYQRKERGGGGMTKHTNGLQNRV